MSLMRTLILVALIALAAILVYIRYAPSEPVEWHVDPFGAPVPSGNGWLVRPADGNAAAAPLAGTMVAVMSALDDIALATPRTTRLVGSAEDGRITYVTRSRLMGYPDYTTVAAMAGPDGITIAVYARQRFGRNDLGVNRARVEGWLAALPRG